MGDAYKAKEHILCLLPFPEDPKILDRLRQKYDVEFTYKQIFFGVGKVLDPAEVPDGKLPLHPLITSPICSSIRFLTILFSQKPGTMPPYSLPSPPFHPQPKRPKTSNLSISSAPARINWVIPPFGTKPRSPLQTRRVCMGLRYQNGLLCRSWAIRIRRRLWWNGRRSGCGGILKNWVRWGIVWVRDWAFWGMVRLGGKVCYGF